MNIYEADKLARSIRARRDSLLDLGAGYIGSITRYSERIRFSNTLQERLTAVANELSKIEKDIKKALENVEVDI